MKIRIAGILIAVFIALPLIISYAVIGIILKHDASTMTITSIDVVGVTTSAQTGVAQTITIDTPVNVSSIRLPIGVSTSGGYGNKYLLWLVRANGGVVPNIELVDSSKLIGLAQKIPASDDGHVTDINDYSDWECTDSGDDVEFTTFEFETPKFMSVGTYAIVITLLDGNFGNRNLQWVRGNPSTSTYSGGSAFGSTSHGNTWYTIGQGDLMFCLIGEETTAPINDHWLKKVARFLSFSDNDPSDTNGYELFTGSCLFVTLVLLLAFLRSRPFLSVMLILLELVAFILAGLVSVTVIAMGIITIFIYIFVTAFMNMVSGGSDE